MLEKRKFIKIASHLICFGLALDLFYVFLYAYVNDFTIIVDINSYGEAKAELILITVTMIFCFVGLVFAWRDRKQ